MKQPEFIWDETLGSAICCVTYNNQQYIGYATCHPDDQDFKSEIVGCTIAEYRARIAALKGYRDNELKPGLKALKQLYYSMNTSKYFQPKSYENGMLTRQIQLKQEDINYINLQITEEKHRLKTYLKNLSLGNNVVRKVRASRTKLNNPSN